MIKRLLLSSLTLCAATSSPLVLAEEQSVPDSQPPAPVEVRTSPLTSRAPVNPLNDVLQDDLWARIRAGFQMTPLDHQMVRDQENWILKHPDYLRRVTERGSRYLYHIVTELEKRGMPTELALLPIVESAFVPDAYSRAHASGLWQFIPSTGKTYGLEQTWWYDGRRDVVAATDAAINYFDYLYSMFGDWNLVLASYNWGEGSVQRAVQKNRLKGLETDFVSLHMPNETRSYVPKLMALKNIVSNPEAYGISLTPIPNRPYFVTVAPNRHIDTTLAAQLADMSVADFAKLNPAYTRPVVASKDNRRILLPVDKADSFLTRLSSYDKPTLTWQAYASQRGESLSDVADRYGISLDELKRLNRLNTRARVASGEILLVPLKASEDHPILAAGEAKVAEPAPVVVRRGSKIASASKPASKPAPVTVVATAPAEPVVPERTAETPAAVSPAPVTTGLQTASFTVQANPRPAPVVAVETPASSSKPEPVTLKLAETVSQPEGKAATATHHKVVTGDTAFSIARRYGLTTQQLLSYNQLKSPALHAGQVLNLVEPQGSSKQAKAEPESRHGKKGSEEARPTIYTVKKGDTLYSIARQYKVAQVDLKKWNANLRRLQPGDQIKLVLSSKG
ncbi:LysM peptidoglycan-binding domain-containing protein [Leeia aquatica]|uniref:LysM peptidoglycan-binding domain-containing protein n=1 Tax=Leeia aquatica TaxID=2725557 RepID=A0A847S465_9NEIS|nr:LysM peptidoglycan-binding domain-containing protein [Leeia aquatica]NLR73947.1 LysM peptidoglycan-binding domain-containing protein [Leeia aquatica]